uniref:Major sperm protein n=1 Tax=Caenorhabditis japonica TaxID=281687 RepID=A0A8R1IRR6_CAEJA
MLTRNSTEFCQRFLDKKEYDLKYSSSIQINDKILSPKFRRKLHEVLSKMSVDENKKNLLNIINLFNSNEFDHDNRKSVSEILGDKGLLDFSMIKYLNDFNSQAVQYLNSKDRSQQAFRIRFIEKYLDFLLREMNNGRPNNQFSSGVTMHQNPSPAERDIFTLIEPKLVYPKQKNWEKTHHVIPIDERPNRRTEPRRVQISERQRRRNNQRQREEIAQVPNILLRIHPEQYGQTEQQPQQWMEQQPSFPSPEYETHQGQLLSPVLQESGPVSNTVIPRKRQNHDDEYLQHKKFRQQDYCAPPNDMLCQPATNVSKDDLDFMSEFLVFENRLNPIKEYPIPQNITMENIEENYQNNFENQISYEFHGAHQYQEREYQPQPTSKWDPELQAALLELGV